jgi:maltose alpha-D-glucosyltransferase/alpha-amylase
MFRGNPSTTTPERSIRVKNKQPKVPAAKREPRAGSLDPDPLWYKDAVIYQTHVKAFQDSNGDGIGDFQGLAERLDHIRDLGATALWILPFYPSPLKDDGYDIADYTGVHPSYGTLADFKNFLREAHARGVRVITELVINHTSDQHPWFQRARRAAPGSAHRDFYVWSDDPEKYKDARIIFKDFEASNWSWDEKAQAYYWHRFYSHQPDLNFDNPALMSAITSVMDFWLELGVDGMRLDAVPYLFEREGTSCENLPETHGALKKLRHYVDANYGDRMLLAEANQWPEDAVAYFGEGRGDECHMAFHFPLMPRMFMALRMEDRYPIIDILAQTPGIPETSQWAIFLRNHDELTLEMVTDEERDYMYRVYATDPRARINLGIRRRLAPLLGNDRRRLELMNGLLFSLPGTPVIYYGDEIGMGDNIYLGDRNGVRTPMQWSADRNAGFSRANPQQLYLPPVIDPEFSYSAVNVEAQQANSHSLLWWMRRLIALRRSYKAFGRGTLEFLSPSNRKVLAFVRRYEKESILVVANLSRFAQFAELELPGFRDSIPVELFGQTEFPPVGDRPYLLTLGPHAFYWFEFKAPAAARELASVDDGGALPSLTVEGGIDELFLGPGRAALERILPQYLVGRRWFGGKARRIKSVQIEDAVPIPTEDGEGHLLLVAVDYADADRETYVLPLCLAVGAASRNVEGESAADIARVHTNGEEGVLYGAFGAPAFAQALLTAVARRRRFRGTAGEIVATQTREFRSLRGPETDAVTVKVLRGEQSNTSVRLGDRLLLKLFRKSEPGMNPDLELGSFLTEQAHFAHSAQVAGALEYRPHAGGEAYTLAILQGFVPNEGDAWRYTLDAVTRYFERVVERLPEEREAPLRSRELLSTIAEGELDPRVQELFGGYLESARLLGQRTAELHLALTTNADDAAFAPEPFTPFYQRGLSQSMRNLAEEVFTLLKGRQRDLPRELKPEIERVLALQPEILKRFRTILARKINAQRCRHHGDFHLGQVLWTGRDFVIIDFEGEPLRPLSTRRIKRSALRDVASMIRSFHYAAFQGLADHTARGVVPPQDRAVFEGWAQYWYTWAAAAFLRSYLQAAKGGAFLPKSKQELDGLLTVYLLEKAVYELGYELVYRPDWVKLPIAGIMQLMEVEA